MLIFKETFEISSFYILKVMARADIVFGNETEADAFGKAMGYETTDRRVIAQKIAALPLEGPNARSRLVVITQGKDPIIVVENGQVIEYHVQKLPDDKIIGKCTVIET